MAKAGSSCFLLSFCFFHINGGKEDSDTQETLTFKVVCVARALLRKQAPGFHVPAQLTQLQGLIGPEMRRTGVVVASAAVR